MKLIEPPTLAFDPKISTSSMAATASSVIAFTTFLFGVSAHRPRSQFRCRAGFAAWRLVAPGFAGVQQIALGELQDRRAVTTEGRGPIYAACLLESRSNAVMARLASMRRLCSPLRTISSTAAERKRLVNGASLICAVRSR